MPTTPEFPRKGVASRSQGRGTAPPLGKEAEQARAGVSTAGRADFRLPRPWPTLRAGVSTLERLGTGGRRAHRLQADRERWVSVSAPRGREVHWRPHPWSWTKQARRPGKAPESRRLVVSWSYVLASGSPPSMGRTALYSRLSRKHLSLWAGHALNTRALGKDPPCTCRRLSGRRSSSFTATRSE